MEEGEKKKRLWVGGGEKESPPLSPIHHQRAKFKQERNRRRGKRRRQLAKHGTEKKWGEKRKLNWMFLGSIPPLLKIRGKSFRGSGIFATHVSNQALFPFEAVQEKGITERKPIKTASGAEMFFFSFLGKVKEVERERDKKNPFSISLESFFP